MDSQLQSRHIVAAGSWFWSVIGVAVGTATLVSLIKSGFAIDLYGIPAKIYQNYVWLRNGIFEPLVWALSYLGLRIPHWLKDICMGYGLFVAAHLRTFQDKRFVDLREMLRQSKESDRTIRLAKFSLITDSPGYPTPGHPAWSIYWAVLWPVFHTELRAMQTWFRGYLETGRVESNLEIALLTYVRGLHRLIVWNLIAIIVCSIVFFLWSYLSNVYGPGGQLA